MAPRSLIVTAGLGNLVTTANFHAFRELNFGLDTLTRPISLEAILEEIKQYDPDDAQEVSRRIRLCANREDTIDQLVMIYGEVIQEYSLLTPEWSARGKKLCRLLTCSGCPLGLNVNNVSMIRQFAWKMRGRNCMTA